MRMVVACMVSLRSTLVPRLSVIFTIRENFRKFPPDTKFPENLQPYQHNIMLSTSSLAICVTQLETVSIQYVIAP